MAASQPTAAEVRGALAAILGSHSFLQAERHKQFLRYVVEETLAGRGDLIKGYTIGTSVLERPDDFDPQLDPVVRVEAGRLRQRLAQYYAEEGTADDVEITIPRGSYKASFRYSPNRGAGAAGTHVAGASRITRRPVAIAAGVAVLILALAAVWLGIGRDNSPDPAGSSEAVSRFVSGEPGWPRLYVSTFANLSGDPGFDYFAWGVSEVITRRLRDFELVVIAPHMAMEPPPNASALADLLEASDADYLLSGSVRSDQDTVRISARITDVETGAQVWNEAYDRPLDLETLLTTQDSIAREVVQVVAEPYGPIFERELARSRARQAGTLSSYDCTLRYYYVRYSADVSVDDRLDETRECFLGAMERESPSADALGGLAMLEIDNFSWGRVPESRYQETLDSAMEMTRRALDLDAEDYFANLALLRVRYHSGDIDGFREIAPRVIELDPVNPLGLAFIATWPSIMRFASTRRTGLSSRCSRRSQRRTPAEWMSRSAASSK